MSYILVMKHSLCSNNSFTVKTGMGYGGDLETLSPAAFYGERPRARRMTTASRPCARITGLPKDRVHVVVRINHVKGQNI